ncbi:MAG: hypothetical protein IJ491_04740 [Clostridia bacterium]|nr:hypothetical protein [Clostridia bacterium]
MSGIISLIITIIMLFESIPLVWVPALEVDASKELTPVSTRATGHLYGLAEAGVPSEAMTDSLDISSVSQKVPDGLQHPTGDISHISSQLEECDYTVVYLQDAYSTWYYCYDEIMEKRKNGTYDWKEFITQSYFPLVRETVEKLRNAEYKDTLVYCIYNECDNAVWFGNYVDGNVLYDETGRQNFFEGWKMTYDYVKSLDPDAVIGGPGFCDYETTKIESFMKYCTENNCVPEVVIYHELAWWSIYDWQAHVDDYRRIENELGIENDLPIVVTEYGEMQDCGNPAKMIHYITQIEKNGTWGQMAYWRLADNLNDTAADDNSPNSNWWLFRKYAEMEGNLLETEVTYDDASDLHDGDWRLGYKGIASINDSKDEIDIIVAGSDNKRAVKVKNLDETNLGSSVNVKIECVYYKGLTGVVSSPTVLRNYNTKSSFGSVNINIPGTDTDAVYFITLSEADEDLEPVRNTNIPVRYEFEEGELLGSAYTYDSAYATTGNDAGMVGGFENDGDGVKITVDVKNSGIYDFDVIFGNSNDGSTSDDRDYTKALFTVDGFERVISLPNTIKSEYTDCYTMQLELSVGRHTIEFSHLEGTFVLDSALLSLHEDETEISLLPDGENACLAVAPNDGYYKVYTDKETAATVDGAKAEFANGKLVYLRRGLNEIENEAACELRFFESASQPTAKKITPSDMKLSDGARVKTDKYSRVYLDGISSEGGKASFNVNVPSDGTYRVTVSYANNREGGYHAYNVDLIETMLTVTANGESQDIFTRSTYSKYTYKTMTFNLDLMAGDNEITLSNSGNVLFNNQVSYAPQLQWIMVNPVNA